MKLSKILVILPVIGLMILVVPFFVRHSVRNSLYSNVNKVPEKEFAIVLGAGIRPNGEPGFLLRKRLDDAIHLYSSKKIKKILVSGDNGKKSYDEISAMARYLENNGIPRDKIFGDYAGFDTYSTMVRARKVFDISSAMVVTQKFHLPRAVYLAKMNDINATGYSTSSQGLKKYMVREWLGTVKSVFDVARGRKPKFHKGRIDVNGPGNIISDN